MPPEELSILNLGRKILPGPEYLQDLVDWSRDSATAIDFCQASGDRCHITYKLLDDLTSALAHRIAEALKATGTHCEDAVIPVLISQSPELYISWIAILKAGAAFCPVAIDSPAERVSFILQDVSASLVLTTAQHESWLAEIAPDILILNASQSTLHCASKCAASEGKYGVKKTVLQSQSLAYIMYTSGQPREAEISLILKLTKTSQDQLDYLKVSR
jgi:non-ribosomal peptide synthetase component F